MNVFKVHSVLLKIRGIAVLICAVAVPAVFFIYFLPHSLPALSLDFLSNSDIAIENIAPAVLLIYAVGLLEILCGAISIYAALLLKAGRTSKNAVNSVFIVLDCLLSIYLLLFGIGRLRSEGEINELIPYIDFKAVGAFLALYAVVALLSDILWFIANRKLKKKQAGADMIGKSPYVFGIWSSVFAIFGINFAFVPGYVFGVNLLIKVLPLTGSGAEQLAYSVNVTVIALILLTVQVIAVVSALLTRKSNKCYLFSALNALCGIGVAACFVLQISQVLVYNVSVYFGEVALLVFSLLTLKDHKKYVNHTETPLPAPINRRYPDGGDVDIIGGRRVLNSRSYSASDGRRG